MISLDDVEDMTCLNRDEIAALAEHEHTSEFDAAILGDYLMSQHHGPQVVQKLICEDVRAALHCGDLAHARVLFATLRHFMANHPEAARGAEPV